MAADSIASAVIVMLPAEIDLTNSASSCAGLLDAASDAGHVIVADMTATIYCDSSGMRMLLAAHDHAAAAGCTLRVAVTPGTAVPRAMALMQIDSVLSVHGSVAEALAAAYDVPAADTGLPAQVDQSSA